MAEDRFAGTEDFLAEARELRERGNLEAALLLLEEVLSIEGASEEVCRQLEDVKDALRWYGKFIQAEDFLETGHISKARELALEIFEEDHTNQQALLFLERCDRIVGDQDFPAEAKEGSEGLMGARLFKADLPERVEYLTLLAHTAGQIWKNIDEGAFHTAQGKLAIAFEGFPQAKPLATLRKELRSREEQARKLLRDAKKLLREGNPEDASSKLLELTTMGRGDTNAVRKLRPKIEKELEKKRREKEAKQRAAAVAAKTAQVEIRNRAEVEAIVTAKLENLIREETKKRLDGREPSQDKEPQEPSPCKGDLYWRELPNDRQDPTGRILRVELVFENRGECEVRLRSLELLKNGYLEQPGRPGSLDFTVPRGKCQLVPVAGCEYLELPIPRKRLKWWTADQKLEAMVMLSADESRRASVYLSRDERQFDPDMRSKPDGCDTES